MTMGGIVCAISDTATNSVLIPTTLHSKKSSIKVTLSQ